MESRRREAPRGQVVRQQAGCRVCDYEGSAYRQAFWESGGRAFEDLADRRAVRRLLPPQGRHLVDVGAGFGRLAPLYAGYENVVLVDYAFSMLADARARLGDRYWYVCADVYRLPLARGTFDAAVMVRVLHHLQDPGLGLAQVARCLRPGGSLVLEHANKRHAKAILRYLVGRSGTNPFSLVPVEFRELHWVFHPKAVERLVQAAGLEVRERRAASHFRWPPLKRMIPASWLAAADEAVGGWLAQAALGPSQYLRAARLCGEANPDGLWRCPACGQEPLVATAQGLPCSACGRLWPRRDGILVLREGATE